MQIPLAVDLVMVVHVLVISNLDYYNMLYMVLPLKMVWKLQLVQNAVVYVHTGDQWLSSCWATAQVSALAANFFKCTGFDLQSLGAGYLQDCLFPFSLAHPLRSSGSDLLRVPLPFEVKGIPPRNRFFSVIAPYLYHQPLLCSNKL